MNTNLYNKNNYPNKPNNKPNIINSLQEVEYFLNNMNCVFTSIKLTQLLKKLK